MYSSSVSDALNSLYMLHTGVLKNARIWQNFGKVTLSDCQPRYDTLKHKSSKELPAVEL